MSYLLVIFGILMLKYANTEFTTEVDQLCASRVGITEDDWMNDAASELQNNCFDECVLTEDGLIDENGILLDDKITEYIIKEVMNLDLDHEENLAVGEYLFEKVISQCANIANKEGKENCQRMHKFVKCTDEWFNYY